MKLFWCPQTRSLRLIWMMEELGRPYERVLIDIRDRAKPRDPDFAMASPMGKVPALRDGETFMSDSSAIALYLADRYASGTLAPKLDDPRRGTFLYWMFFVPGVVEPAMMEKVAGITQNPQSYGHGSYDQMVDVLWHGVEKGPWLLGDQFTAADVMVGSTIYFMKSFGIMQTDATVDAYLGRCLARPAYKKAFEINDAGA